jgi:DNA-binding MarR family transcriptional regulator
MGKSDNRSLAKTLVYTGARLEMIGNRYIFEPLGMTSSSMRILDMLMKHKRLTPTELLDRIGSSKSNITQRLNFLEKCGLIERIESARNDKRQTVIALTGKGGKKYRAIAAMLKKRTMHIEKFFCRAEIDEMGRFLKKLNKLMDEHERCLSK